MWQALREANLQLVGLPGANEGVDEQGRVVKMHVFVQEAVREEDAVGPVTRGARVGQTALAVICIIVAGMMAPEHSRLLLFVYQYEGRFMYCLDAWFILVHC